MVPGGAAPPHRPELPLYDQPKAQENVETVRRGSNNVVEFLQSEGYIRFRADYEPVPSPSIRHIKSGARTMCASPVS